MRNAIRFTFGSFIALAVAIFVPSEAAAQSDGCPWCTTPTSCEEVDENADIGGCYNIGDGCREIDGSSTIEVELAAARREATLVSNGIEYHGEATVALRGEQFEVIGINDGLFARWGCDGALSAVFKRGENGEWIVLDPAQYSERFSLRNVVSGGSLTGE